MRITYDASADALYIRVRDKAADEANPKTRELGPGVMMDVDAKGNPMGFEILWASERYPAESLADYEAGQFISLAQAGKVAGLSANTLKVQAAAGRLKAEKHGRNWVTTAAWLNEYLGSRKYNAKEADNAIA